ncbi:MAG: trans-sulfuration enzyme family protein [Planctomycetota bacterium]|jgi:cystathionine beta-lyase/cystathionine gamma-synthase
MGKDKANSPEVPIYRSAGFALNDPDKTKQAFLEELDHPRSPEQYIYSRYRNPTVVSAEERIMAIEGSRWALLTQSGMSAIDLALTLYQRGKDTGTWLFSRDIYGGTNSYIDTVLTARRGLKLERFEAEDNRFDLAKLERLLDSVKPELLFFEGVSNPMLIVADGEAVIQAAKRRGMSVIVDNTFGTPLLWKPLEQGADLVIHSATKYLGGHNNITAGVICGNDPDLEKAAVECRKWIGHMLSPDDAYRLETQLKTFELRFERHCENAFRLAKSLDAHPKVEKVLYPGLESHPTHGEAKKLFQGKGFGAMITFDLAGESPEAKHESCRRFISEVAGDIPLVPTLGDVGTILLPVEAVWGEKYPFPGMIRLSVGIEPFEVLEASIKGALESLA